MTAYDFEPALWVGDARRVGLWTFVSLPPDQSEEIAQGVEPGHFVKVRIELVDL